MLDIVKVENGKDLKVYSSVAPKAANVVSTQLGSLEYAQAFGSDLKYFINSDFRFQNDSFKAYLVTRLTQHQINVVDVLETIESLYNSYTYFVGEIESTGEGFVS